jgi:hypothetical protein
MDVAMKNPKLLNLVVEASGGGKHYYKRSTRDRSKSLPPSRFNEPRDARRVLQMLWKVTQYNTKDKELLWSEE